MRRQPKADAPATEELVAFGYSPPRKVSERDHSSNRNRPAPRRGRARASTRALARASKRARPTLRRGRLEDDVTTTRRGRAPRLDVGTPCVGFCPVASALDDVDGEAALR